jgi:hypothetical protein
MVIGDLRDGAQAMSAQNSAPSPIRRLRLVLGGLAKISALSAAKLEVNQSERPDQAGSCYGAHASYPPFSAYCLGENIYSGDRGFGALLVRRFQGISSQTRRHW